MKTLFDTTLLSGIRVKNRFVRSATWEKLADDNGHITDIQSAIYEELAINKVGLIITGNANIIASDIPSPKMMGMYDDSFIDEYRKLTDRVHSHGSAIVMQLVHGGSNTGNIVANRVLLAPSAVENIAEKTMPKEISKTEIQEVIQAFAAASYRAEVAGFDGIQLHIAHGYLLSQFLNPYYNRRIDEYGGSVENRSRIIIETLKAIRKVVSRDFVLMAKINCEDFMENGLTAEDSLAVCKLMAENGLNAVEVSGGSGSSRKNEGAARNGIIRKEKESYFKDYAAKIAEQVDIPVMLVGGNRSIELMTEILNTTKIGYFSLSRPLLREPDLIARWESGDTEKAKCISCNRCFTSDDYRHCMLRE
jgi:2,4-dienoyl-CoA reductase-like NADH-dependent reductase (Old Yellow Enzyme family)